MTSVACLVLSGSLTSAFVIQYSADGTRVARKFDFYTGSADHVPKENLNKNVGSS